MIKRTGRRLALGLTSLLAFISSDTIAEAEHPVNDKRSAEVLKHATSTASSLQQKSTKQLADPFLEELVDDNIRDLLTREFNGFKKGELPNQNFGIVALSNIAEGLVCRARESDINEDEQTKAKFVKYLDKLVNIAIDQSVAPYSGSIFQQENLGNHGMYLSHLNIVLGEYENVAKDGKYKLLNQRISKYLARKITKSKDKHMKSYAKKQFKWPADHAATLYSLFLYDKNFTTADAKIMCVAPKPELVSEEPIKQWLQYMNEHATDEETGLFYSEITGKTNYSNIPRGCAMSWTLKYMARFAPKEAKELWKNYKRHFLQNISLLAGFREWPKGVNRKGDIDSGPIYLGMGAAATAFGRGAAKNIGDLKVYAQLSNSMNLGFFASEYFDNPTLKKNADNLLASAIRFSSSFD